MTWTKLGDEYGDECWTLSDPAYRLHNEGLIWSNRKLTDGKLSKDDMNRWARHPDAAEELVSIGFWEDRGEHFQIIHHIGYQRTRDQVAKQSLANSKNRAKGKARPVKPKDDSSEESSDRDESSDESSDEMDRTGQDRTGLPREEKSARASVNPSPTKHHEPELGLEDFGADETFNRRRPGCICIDQPRPCYYCELANEKA